MLISLLFTSLYLFGCAQGTPLPFPTEGNIPDFGQLPVSPDLDPFYKPPPGYESAAPGDILRYRPTPHGITIDDTQAIQVKASWQFLYRTQNSVGDPEATVVTVIIPYNAKKNNLFSYSYMTEAAYNGCNPSVSLQRYVRDDNKGPPYQNSLIVAALSQGWYVSIADDAGPQGAYVVGPQLAYATLDSIRAVKLSANLTGISANPVTTLFGYSAGSYATAWASEFQPFYAPDVKIAGVAHGGIQPNTTALIEHHNAAEFSKYGPPALMGYAHDFANLSTWLDNNLIPERAAEYKKAGNQCFSSNYMFDKKDLSVYFKNGLASMKEPVPASVFRIAGTMGLKGTPEVPWYLFETTTDEGNPIGLVDILVDTYCKRGANILYERSQLGLDHGYEFVAGFSGAFSWIRERHAGISVVPGCKTTYASTDTFKGLLKGELLTFTFDNILAYLGVPVGAEGKLGKAKQALGWRA